MTYKAAGHPFARTATLGAVALAALLPACASKPNAGQADNTTPVNTGLSQFTQPQNKELEARQAALTALAEQSAIDLERVLAAQQAQAQGQPAAQTQTANMAVALPAGVAPTAPAPAAPTATDSTIQAAAAANGLDPAVLAAAVAAAQQVQQTPRDQRSPQEKIPQLTADLATLIRQRAESAQAPLSDYLILAALEAGQQGLLGDGATFNAKVSAKLSSSEMQLLTAFRSFIAAMSPASAESTDPVATAARLADAFPPVAAVLPLRIAEARLCTKVSGFGAYSPFPSQVFQAGRPQQAIVYVEIDRFAHRPAKSTDPGVSDVPSFNTPAMWSVEISQELNLHHDSDGSLQWRQAPQVVVEASRRQRRDFYLIQQVELPPTLTVGNYTLKITVRDRVNDAVAEATIPIQIVADASLAAGQN